MSSSRCEDCGTGMDGGFCPNCHEEVFIMAQNPEMEFSPEFHHKVNEQISNERRQEVAGDQRSSEQERIRNEHFALFNEYPKN